MPKTALTADDRTDVLSIKASLLASKNGLKDAIVTCAVLMDRAEAAYNAAKVAGDDAAEEAATDDYNAAYLAKETFRRCLADVGVAHANASMSMNRTRNARPETFGPGGGRKP